MGNNHMVQENRWQKGYNLGLQGDKRKKLKRKVDGEKSQYGTEKGYIHWGQPT
jgi:hypothetical protein